MLITDNDSYIQYRFQRAGETFEEAILMAQNKHWNAAMNRLYYACFYAVIAVLISDNIESKSHNGVRYHFFLHLIKSERIDRKWGKLYTELYLKREKGDYGDFFDFGEEDVLPALDSVREFLSIMEQLIRKNPV
jgi:uncharacterized protein (UPF0332 family)